MGRKNAVLWEIAGSAAAAAWDAEASEALWIGHRDAPNQVLLRDPGLMNAQGAAVASLPGGHVEGYADTFYAMFRQVYGDVAAGGRQDGSTWATFEDGHFGTQFCDAVLHSAAEGRWVSVEARA
jgi:predicted dehydrogenase